MLRHVSRVKFIHFLWMRQQRGYKNNRKILKSAYLLHQAAIFFFLAFITHNVKLTSNQSKINLLGQIVLKLKLLLTNMKKICKIETKHYHIRIWCISTWLFGLQCVVFNVFVLFALLLICIICKRVERKTATNLKTKKNNSVEDIYDGNSFLSRVFFFSRLVSCLLFLYRKRNKNILKYTAQYMGR